MSTLATIDFATQLLELVHRASTTTSYKYALLVALIECASENVGLSGREITTRQLAARVLELYWPQARAFDDGPLRQNASGGSLVDRIAAYRDGFAKCPGSAQQARALDPAGYAAVLDEVEWVLIRYPIPLLQRLGGQSLDLLYDGALWPEQPRRGPVRSYQRSLAARGRDPAHGFENRLVLHAGVASMLAALAPLFLPLIRREWTRFVARQNRRSTEDEELHLEEFLFEPQRESLTALRPELARLQDNRCFYCDEGLGRGAEVDHFLAWSRCGVSAIENLVVAHGACNGNKSDALVAARHLERWTGRLQRRRDDLGEIAARRNWYVEPRRVGALVQGSYAGLGGRTPLWLGRERWVMLGEDAGLEPGRRALSEVVARLG